MEKETSPARQSSPSRKSSPSRRVLTLQKKKEILDAHEQEKSWVKLSKQFDLPDSTIRTIVSNKHKIISALDEGSEAKRTKVCSAKHPELESATVSWLKSARNQNIELSGPLIKEKAKELAERLNIKDFEASNGWLSNLKQRHSITLHSEQGEAGAVNIESLEEWRQTVLKSAVAEIEPIDDELAEMWNGLEEKEGELTDYIEADDYLTTAAVPTIEQIADEFLAVDDVMEEDEESEEIAEERPRVSENEAYKAMQIVQDYIQSNSANPAILKHADELDEYISKKCMEKRKQSKISDYFEKL
ncbi:tc5 transposase DNA-binding domain-containing protein [Ditylenchus destructor]|uniref:Tc5 transposase DNA-binding domain-containing protein n=1 Tax=Ditylenchus destructor TaxID=166010 RepID=A0AAD4QXU6_9BILA|nr:tc5 transposase DNA-binding domain-containing protein [Ditylenchus destructor]